MKQGTFETILGILILLVATIFFFYAYKISGLSDTNSQYKVIATFDNIDGIMKGTDIKISGIKIGEVSQIELELDSYYATVILSLNKGVDLPIDSRAQIVTSGFIGNKYIDIKPGVDEKFLQDNDKLIYTKSAMNIENLINKLVYSFTNNKQNN
ncbi:MAG: outer membrane lipid asymmetry maintenance protein MlaD [Rickettsiaceae bacterium]|nr:outer membrane lipid asymmetry maintenance protein MlaD [Rickettsiaceae bacterium]